MTLSRNRNRTFDVVAFRQSLLQLLECDPPQEAELLKELERHRQQGEPVYSSLLSILTHLSFSEVEARRHFREVAAHRARIREALGRDVGLRVAILDYFVNVNHELRNPKVIEISIYERTERSAVTDGLTGLFNHAYFEQSLKRELQRAKRHGLKASVVLFDLDNFKRVNDTFGHPEGDRVLMKVSAFVKQSLREMDVAARYGGEEFAVILPDTDRVGGHVVAERIRKRIDDHFRRRRSGGSVTISGGVATFPEDADSFEDLVQRADEGLYRSKAAGKNCITLSGGERRQHLRIPTSHKISVKGEAGRSRVASARNVSEGGLLVRVKAPVALGSTVSMVFRPGDGSTVGVRGEVVRVLKSSAGTNTYDLGVRLAVESTGAGTALALRRLQAGA